MPELVTVTMPSKDHPTELVLVVEDEVMVRHARSGAACSVRSAPTAVASPVRSPFRPEETMGHGVRQHGFAHLAPPGEKQTGIHVMAGSDIAGSCARFLGLSATIRSFSSTVQRRRR
jgi:hypothetical protein